MRQARTSRADRDAEHDRRQAMTTRLRRGGERRTWAAMALRHAERDLLERYHEPLSGRVLELGCGGGRITGHLINMGAVVHGMDIAADMVVHCQTVYPQATFSQEDFRDLSKLEFVDFDAAFAGYTSFDVLSDKERGTLLDDVHRLLRKRGLFIFSSHNLACAQSVKQPTQITSLHPVRFTKWFLRRPRCILNHHRMAPLQRFEDDYAIINDEALDYSLLHYYIGRDGQDRQLARHGFELLECVDLDGRVVRRGPVHNPIKNQAMVVSHTT